VDERRSAVLISSLAAEHTWHRREKVRSDSFPVEAFLPRTSSYIRGAFLRSLVSPVSVIAVVVIVVVVIMVVPAFPH
jgi:hypothetical protein